MTKASSDPAIIVIFGITGDLSERYLLPALYHLFKDELLHPATKIIGVTRGSTTTTELYEKVEVCVNEVDKVCDPVALKAMHDNTEMFRMDLDEPASYDALKDRLNAIEDEQGMCLNRLYYLSIPPTAYRPVVRLLGERGLNASCQHNVAASRLLVEKPFGHDLESAKELIEETGRQFNEQQIFRIDHYLAKDMVQNILSFRLQNPAIESLWSKDFIESIEIIAKEKITVGGRADFYEPLGALRDFIQNHLLQILGLVTIDRPEDMKSTHIHAAKLAALKQIETIPADKVKERAIRGQYRGYREEVNNPDSTTETYASITVTSSNPRWQNVSMTLTTGKALDERKSEVVLNLRNNAGKISFQIQPKEGVEVTLASGLSGLDSEVQKFLQELSAQSSLRDTGRSTAYERVLLDALKGDHTVFASSDEVLESWRIIQPVINAWSANDSELVSYEPGTAGPAS